MSQSYEVGFITMGSGAKPDGLTVKLFDKTLVNVVQEFVKRFPPTVFYPIGTPVGVESVDYDEYWLEYRRDVQVLHSLFNLWLWISVSDLPGLKKLAEQAAKQIQNTSLNRFEDLGDGRYELTFCVDGKETTPFKIPYDIMDEAAENGQDNLEQDIEDLFFNLIVRHQMRIST